MFQSLLSMKWCACFSTDSWQCSNGHYHFSFQISYSNEHQILHQVADVFKFYESFSFLKNYFSEDLRYLTLFRMRYLKTKITRYIKMTKCSYKCQLFVVKSACYFIHKILLKSLSCQYVARLLVLFTSTYYSRHFLNKMIWCYRKPFSYYFSSENFSLN